MEVIITDWALNSYLDHVSAQVFTKAEYKNVLRPDALLLKTYPADPKFKLGKFWSVAKDAAGNVVPDGYKMKWHNIGSGKVQLRLPVGIVNDAYLCQAYVKKGAKQEQREIAKFKVHLKLVRQGKANIRGKLP